MSRHKSSLCLAKFLVFWSTRTITAHAEPDLGAFASGHGLVRLVGAGHGRPEITLISNFPNRGHKRSADPIPTVILFRFDHKLVHRRHWVQVRAMVAQ